MDTATEATETRDLAPVDPDAALEEAEPAAISMRPDDQGDTERSNLAAAMTAEMQKVIAAKVRERFDRDLSSRSDRMKRLKDIQEAYALVPKPKNFQFHKAANVRTPTERLGDLRAQVAANWRAAARLQALAAKYGTDTLLDIMQEVQDYSETMMRAALRALPDGEAEFTISSTETASSRRARSTTRPSR